MKNILIAQSVPFINTFTYHVEFIHPDTGSVFYTETLILQDGYDYNVCDSATFKAEVASTLWNKYNRCGYYHEMRITFENCGKTFVEFEGGLYDLAALEEAAAEEAYMW